MPQIIVTAGDSGELEGEVTLRERINASDFESERFTVNLVERLGWAVDDAAEAERHRPATQDAPGAVASDQTVDNEAIRELVKA
jgi:hypothetical protein